MQIRGHLEDQCARDILAFIGGLSLHTKGTSSSIRPQSDQSLIEKAVCVIAGHAWISEYGDPHNKTDFEYMYKYSPLHNVRVPAGSHQYPAILLTTGDMLRD